MLAMNLPLFLILYTCPVNNDSAALWNIPLNCSYMALLAVVFSFFTFNNAWWIVFFFFVMLLVQLIIAV